MTFLATHASVGILRRPRTRYLAAAGIGLALVAAVAAATQLASGGSSPVAAPAPTVAVHKTQVEPRIYWYIVGDEQAASDLQQMLFGIVPDSQQAAGVEPTFSMTSVVQTPADEAQTQLAIADTNAIRVAQGLPEVTVIDMR